MNTQKNPRGEPKWTPSRRKGAGPRHRLFPSFSAIVFAVLHWRATACILSLRMIGRDRRQNRPSDSVTDRPKPIISFISSVRAASSRVDRERRVSVGGNRESLGALHAGATRHVVLRGESAFVRPLSCVSLLGVVSLVRYAQNPCQSFARFTPWAIPGKLGLVRWTQICARKNPARAMRAGFRYVRQCGRSLGEYLREFVSTLFSCGLCHF